MPECPFVRLTCYPATLRTFGICVEVGVQYQRAYYEKHCEDSVLTQCEYGKLHVQSADERIYNEVKDCVGGVGGHLYH